MSFIYTYRANGKLLLTGEYFVLHAAKAIAIPLKLGQQMTISAIDRSKEIHWQARFQDKIWFECVLSPDDFFVLKTNDEGKSEVLSNLFKTIKQLNPEFSPKAGIKLETKLESNPEWGFGSSSTLVSLLSQWAGVDPFKLNEMVFHGSGFDIACATANGPIFFTRYQAAVPVSLNFPFADQLFMVYSGQKKGTANEVRSFLKEKTVSEKQIAEMSAISEEFAQCSNQDDFNRLIQIHEKMIGRLIEQTPVKEQYFCDFDGAIKSLGAWGGDFWLISTKLPFSGVKEYFENKGLKTLFKWNDLILNSSKP